MNIKFNPLFVLLIALLPAAVIIAVLKDGTVPSFSNSRRYCVVLDAGHGAPDGGAVGPAGTQEKDINLDTVLKLREILESRGVKVILTRESDSELNCDVKLNVLKNRLEIINNSGPDLFLSIHMNSFSDPSSSGLHIFFSRNHPEAEETAVKIQNSLTNVTGAKTHAVKAASDSLYLMKNPKPPAILAECGFISNPNEEKLLCDENYRAKIAFAIADAILDSLEPLSTS